MSKWKFVYILHNFIIDKPFENNYMAIVNEFDNRVKGLITKHPCLNRLVTNFTDQHGNKQNVSILIIKEDAPQKLYYVAPIVGFRNILAISTITNAWQYILTKNQNLGYINYSDYFDIYPIAPTKDNKYIIVHSPAIKGWDDCDDFAGQTSPGISTNLKSC